MVEYEQSKLGELEKQLLHAAEMYLINYLRQNILFINNVSLIGIESVLQSKASIDLVTKAADDIRNSNDPWLRDMYLVNTVITGYTGYMNGDPKEE